MRDRTYFFTPPQHAIAWYTAHCCPACGRVNNTGQLCPETTRCMNPECGAIQCKSVKSECRRCGAPLAGFWKSEENYQRWEKRQARLARARARSQV